MIPVEEDAHEDDEQEDVGHGVTAIIGSDGEQGPMRRVGRMSMATYLTWTKADDNRRRGEECRQEEIALRRRLEASHAAFHNARKAKRVLGRGQLESAASAVRDVHANLASQGAAVRDEVGPHPVQDLVHRRGRELELAQGRGGLARRVGVVLTGLEGADHGLRSQRQRARRRRRDPRRDCMGQEQSCKHRATSIWSHCAPG